MKIEPKYIKGEPWCTGDDCPARFSQDYCSNNERVSRGQLCPTALREQRDEANAQVKELKATIERVRGLERYECSSAGRFYVSASDLDAVINPKTGEGE